MLQNKMHYVELCRLYEAYCFSKGFITKTIAISFDKLIKLLLNKIKKAASKLLKQLFYYKVLY